ncbi:apolipoprotein B-100 [Genypterus blacodes]|uniref:apolipoprotein B-100 n=1 Tax=Genypterus blacodes TaxID=154954 RepID=UPI003F761F84
MGNNQLLLLLLLSSYTLAEQPSDNNEQAACSLASRFKAFKKYTYQYSTESTNGVDGSSRHRSGHKVTCQVEIEVPQTCSFILNTKDCNAFEVTDTDPEGEPVFTPADSSEAFQAAMAKNLLKFNVDNNVWLFPEEDEPLNILNIKRGIISGLLVPEAEDQELIYTSTVHGVCAVYFQVNARRDIATDVTLNRDLSMCDYYGRHQLTHSPLALLQNLNFNSSTSFRSTQACNYQFDNKRKHVTAAECTENHVYAPLSGDNGISSVVKQWFVFQDFTRTSNRLFEVNPSRVKTLRFEDLDDKAAVQTKEAVLRVLQDLVGLADTDGGQSRTSLFYKLVSSIRSLKRETLSQMVPEMLDTSGLLTWQALLQCGTPECSSAVLQAIRTIDGLSLEVDALVYGLSRQDDPDEHRVRDMLSMAQYRQSKAIMYALANTVKKFYTGEVTPAVADVANFMETLLQDCSEDTEMSFLALKVVAVMGQAMQAAGRDLISSLSRCARRTDVPLSNQKAAIQAFRLMEVTDEVGKMLVEVYGDDQSNVEKRIAAYLILMKNPDPMLLADIVRSLKMVREPQLSSFVVSHLMNLRFNDPQTELEDIVMALTDQLDPANFIPENSIGMSQNHKIDTEFASVQLNVVFDSMDTLPKEVMLETTLKALGYDDNAFEIGIEGSGFEPTIDALFGEKGFFPDAVSRVLYWAGNNAPETLKQVLDRLAPASGRMKRQIPQDLVKDITDFMNRLVDEIRSSPVPEATAYLRLLGEEIGYIKTSEMKQMAETLFMYYQFFFRILPVQAIRALISSTENDIFGHYIFMERSFSVPTISGFPLKLRMACVFAAGARGGVTLSSSMNQLSFMPSVGLECITTMGVDLPDVVVAGVEIHTNMYHESSINAKVSINSNQIRLSIPNTKSTQLFSVSNNLLSVSSGRVKIVPSMVENRTDSTECQPLITGLDYCTVTRYSNPYHPLTEPTKFAVELQPTGEVPEYTATISSKTVREGKDGRRNKIETLKLTLKAEGVDSTEATASLTYNRNKNTVTTEVVIPDYDVEAGINLAVSDTNTKGKKMRGITIDVTNKNIPQLTLVGRMRSQMMKDAMLQVQMAVPSLNADGSVTATLKLDEGVFLNVETAFNLPETTSEHKASFKYDDNKMELELNSDLNSEVMKLMPDTENYYRQLQQLLDDMLDQKVAKTDMKLRHIVTKGIEAGNIWLDKLAAGVPYFANPREKRSIADLTLPALPEKLFLQSDTLFRYQFNKDKVVISLPLPLGGQTSKDLDFPSTVSTPSIDLPEIGLNVPAANYRLPSFTIPRSLEFMVPLLGLFEASTKINSNFYSWEGSVSGGNNTIDVPSYIAQYKAMAQSPFNLLSYKLEGAGMISGPADDNMKYLANGSFSHSFIETSFSAVDTVSVTSDIQARANYKFEALSPLGLHTSVYYSGQASSPQDSEDVSGDGNLDATIKIGPVYTNTSYSHSYTVRPQARQGKGKSDFRVTSPFLQLHNVIDGVYADSELDIVSKTNLFGDILKHSAEFKYKDAQVTMKCSTVARAVDKTLNNKVELGLSKQMALLRIESQADDDTNRAYSLITGSLDSNGLEINSEGSLIFDAGRGLHKASVMLDRNGLTTSGVNSIQCSPVTLENIFNGAINYNGAVLSSESKAMAEESKGELNFNGKITGTEASLHGDLKGHIHDASTRNNMDLVLNRKSLTFSSNTLGTLKEMKTENNHKLTLSLWSLALQTKTSNFICNDVYYKQNTMVDMKPFVVSFHTTNDLKMYDASLGNEGHMKLEPMKISLSGGIKGAYGEEQTVMHKYEFHYDDMAGTLKSSTSGNLMGAQLSHDCELEFAGLAAKSICEAQINSELLRFGSNIRTVALPFRLTIDALVNSDGKMNLYGEHTGQLYSKLLVTAEPLALAYSHDSRVSTAHMLPSGELATQIENVLNGLVTPNEQSLSWKTKSKLNELGYHQDMSAYNNPEKIGIEFSGVVLTDHFSGTQPGVSKRSAPESEEFSVSGFLKYDKNSDCHIIQIPFIESIPAAFEQLKTTVLNSLESLQRFINDLDLNRVIAEFRTKLDQLPSQVIDFMRDMDLQAKVDNIKEKLAYMTDEFSFTMDDLEKSMNKLRNNIQHTVTDVAIKIKNFILTIRDYFRTGQFTDMATNLLSQIGNDLKALDEKYEVKHSLVRTINAIEDIIGQIDLQKLTESSAAWLRDLDSNYGILEKIKEKISELKRAMETFDIKEFCQDVKDYIVSTDMAALVEQLSYRIPASEIAGVIESMNEVVVNWIEEYEITNKLNAVYFYIRDLLVKYELDVKFKELLDQAVVLIKEFKIEDTVQSVADALKTINLEYVYDRIIQLLQTVTSRLQAIDFTSFDELNKSISSTLKSIRSFDYDAFVDESNQKIVELTNYINEQIKTYEIVQKSEALREFFRELQNSIITYLEELKNTKVAEVIKKLHNVMDTTVYNDVKMKLQEILEDMRHRILYMDIRDEMNIHLQRASESYTNVMAYISFQVNRLIEGISRLVKDQEITDKIQAVVDDILDALKIAEIEVPAFLLPLTDLMVPAFTINLNKLQEISIPAQISVPKFTILNYYTIPAFTIDFEEIKAKVIAIIDQLRELQIQMPDPEDIFGDLKVLYLFELPDLTFPEIKLSEIRFPVIEIPKLELQHFEITVLPIPEIRMPEIHSDVCITLFGKLYGEFKVSSPHHNFLTTGKIENSTATAKHPHFSAIVTSTAQSTIELLEYTLEATAQLEAPKMKKLLFTENVLAIHTAFSIHHEGSLTLTGSSAEASAKTEAKATTQMYTADLVNNMEFSLKSGISAEVQTAYSHMLNIPAAELSSETILSQNVVAKMEPGTITVTTGSTGNGKWSIRDYSDEGIHKSNLALSISYSTAKLTFVGETLTNTLTMRQMLTAESVALSHVTVEARAETDGVFIKRSVMVLNGKADVGDLRIALTAHHDAELTESLSGSMSNSLEFMAHPFEIVLDAKNKLNSKMIFPIKLTGKVDLQHDLGVILNSENQRASWFTLARFNQYKYNHNLILDNNERDMLFHLSANGEANLDFLTVPLTVPELRMPYLDMSTPEINRFSLWEDTGLKTLLATPQQSFDVNLKLQYHKSPDVHSFELDLAPIYNTILDNTNMIHAQFEQSRDKIVASLKDSYNEAKSQYVKHKIDTSSQPPRFFTVPGYKIPILDIEVSAFRAELPAFSYIVPKEVSTPGFKIPALGFTVPSYTLVLPSLELPVIHVPDTLSELKLPTFTFPTYQDNIAIPAMGNITYDFSFKSTVLTLNVNAGLYKESDIVGRFGASSVSVFDILNGKLDSTTSLTSRRGVKLATTVSLMHQNVEANHDCAVSLIQGSVEASVANTAKITLPILILELNQQLTGNTKSKPGVDSKMNLKYMFNIPLIESVGEGDVDLNLALEVLSSYVSLGTTAKGKSDMTLMLFKFAGDLVNGATVQMHAERLDSTARTVFSMNIDKNTKQKRGTNNIFHFDLIDNFALEVSPSRVFAEVDYISHNNVDLQIFRTNGKHVVKGELDYLSSETLKATVDVAASQPSSFGRAELLHNVNIAMSSEKQSFLWGGKEQLAEIIHACDVLLSNDEAEVRMELTESLEGHLSFLKSVKIPVYHKTLWDVLKFDQVTNKNDLQFLNISSSVVYTKTNDVMELELPSELFETGVTLSLPEISIAVPTFVREIQRSIWNADMEDESSDGPDEVADQMSNFDIPTVIFPEQDIELSYSLPSSVFIPALGALATTLKVSSPIYKVTTTANLERKDSSLVTSLNSVCDSTMVFLAYELDAKATLGFDNGAVSLNGKCNLIHSDITVDWQHVFAQDIRMKRQTSQADAVASRHTLNVDITSPTFTDASFRFASRKDGFTASVSSLSSGFLGLHIQRRSPSQLYGKLFCRYLSAPEKDMDMLTFKATLRNSEKFSIQAAWNLDGIHQMIEGSKDRTPAVTEAVLNFINKYHTAHFGFDLNRGGMKVKNVASNTIETAYHEVRALFYAVQRSAIHLRDQSKDMYRKATDRIAFMDIKDVTKALTYNARKFLRHSEDTINVLLDTILMILSEISFTLPGSEERLTGLKMLQQARRSASGVIHRAIQLFSNLMETIYTNFREMEFTIPGTDVVVNGERITENLESSLSYIPDQLLLEVKQWFGVLRRAIRDAFQTIAEKGSDLIANLKAENQEVAAEIEGFYAEVKRQIWDVRNNVAEYKDLTKQAVHDAYDAVNTEDVNNGIKELIDIVQSHFYGGLNESIDLLRRASKSTQPYIKMSNKKLDIDVPLPFYWKSFSELPTQSRQ